MTKTGNAMSLPENNVPENFTKFVFHAKLVQYFIVFTTLRRG